MAGQSCNLAVNKDTEPVSDADTVRDLAQDKGIIGMLRVYIADVGSKIRRMTECQNPVLREDSEVSTIESDGYIPDRRIQSKRA